MKSSLTVFGAKACVHIVYVGELESLARKLSKGFLLSEFRLENNEEEPHEPYAAAELMGFEIWLEKTAGLNSYLLKIETSNCLEESFNDQMYDLSPWLARYLSDICGVEIE